MDFGEFRTQKDGFSELYRDADEQMPHTMPTQQGQSLVVTAFVDVSHGANKVTRQSHTGYYVIFINRAPIIWYSKRQQTVETSTFWQSLSP
jgi:hypothetical protein